VTDDAAREKTEATEKVELYAQQVAAGHRIPASTWAEPLAAADPAKRVLKAHLAAVDIETVRAETKLLVGQPRALGGGETKPVVSSVAGLTEYELAMCERRKLDPKAYAASPARVNAAKAAGG
jgi:hypothetical protein